MYAAVEIIAFQYRIRDVFVCSSLVLDSFNIRIFLQHRISSAPNTSFSFLFITHVSLPKSRSRRVLRIIYYDPFLSKTTLVFFHVDPHVDLYQRLTYNEYKQELHVY